MSFRQRDEINRELGRASDPYGGGHVDINTLMDDSAYERSHGQGTQGTATRHITANYDSTEGAFDPDRSIGKLDSKADRYKVLNELTQQQGGGGDAEARCGSTVLLAGSLLAGGGAGINTLIDAVEAFKRGNTKGKLDEDALKQIAMLDKIKEKIAKGKELTAGDLGSISSGVMGLTRSDDPTQYGGLKDKDMEKLMASSPELRRLWKNNDLSYDSVDVTGGGSGGHAVLGIGHGSGDANHTGPHAAIYDPYHRAKEDPEAARHLAEVQQKIGEAMSSGQAANMAELVEAQARAKHHELGQLITDPRELKAYQSATMKGYEFTSVGKGSGVQYHGYNPANVFNGMY